MKIEYFLNGHSHCRFCELEEDCSSSFYGLICVLVFVQLAFVPAGIRLDY